MKYYSFFVLFFIYFVSNYSHAAEENSSFDSTLRFNPHTSLGFDVAHREGIKGSGTIAIIDNGIYAPHPALTEVKWINCTNADDKVIYEYFQKKIESNSKDINIHPLMVSGIIACKPLEIGEGIPGIDYNIGLAHEANVTVYLTAVYCDEPFQCISGNDHVIKSKNTECNNWIQAFTKIKDSKARIICTSCAIPYNVDLEIDMLIKKENRGFPYIPKDLLLAIQNCVSDEDNGRLLVISSSNKGRTIGEDDGTWPSMAGFKYFEELTNDPIISKRLIIVGNSSLGLTGNIVCDQGHPKFLHIFIDYYKTLKRFLSEDGLKISFKDFIQHNSLFQDIRKSEIEKIVKDKMQLMFGNIIDSYVFQHNYSIVSNLVEKQYPQMLKLELIEAYIKDLRENYIKSCRLYPFQDDHHISLHFTSGKGGMAQNIFLTTIGTTILTAKVSKATLNFPGGSLETYGRAIGTSFSTPIVASAVNLLLQVNPHLSIGTAKELLFATADKPTWFPEIHGQGEMNFLKAYEQAKTEKS